MAHFERTGGRGASGGGGNRPTWSNNGAGFGGQRVGETGHGWGTWGGGNRPAGRSGGGNGGGRQSGGGRGGGRDNNHHHNNNGGGGGGGDGGGGQSVFDDGRKRDREKSKRYSDYLLLNDFWENRISSYPAELVKLNNEVINIFPPPHIPDKCYALATLLRKPCPILTNLDCDWINANQYPESLRTSSVLRISVSNFEHGARLAFLLRVPVEEMRLHIETLSSPSSRVPLPEPLREVEKQMAKDRQSWYVAMFRRFPRENFGLTKPSLDPRLLLVPGRDVNSRQQGFLIPECGDPASSKSLDYSYTGTYFYFFKRHSQWNQVLIPEFVTNTILGGKPLYRMKMIIPHDGYGHLSSTKTLYLEVVDIESFIAGKAQNIRMTCDQSKASFFIFKPTSSSNNNNNNNHSNAITFDEVVNNQHYWLYLCTRSGSEYPIYLARSEVFYDEAPLNGSHYFAKLLHSYKSGSSNNEKADTATEDDVNDEDEDDRDQQGDDADQQDRNELQLLPQEDILERITQAFSTTTATTGITDPELLHVINTNVLFHPFQSWIGFRNMNITDAFHYAMHFYQYVTSGAKKVKDIMFNIDIRHGKFQESYQYGIGCTADGTPTCLNQLLAPLDEDSDSIQEWSRVSMQIELDFNSYLLLLPTPEARYDWLKRALHHSLPKDMLADHQVHQRVMTSDLIAEVKEIVEETPAAQSNHVFRALGSTENELLKRRCVKNFTDLHIHETSFLEFALNNERVLSDIFRFNRVDPHRDGCYQRVENIGIRFLLDFEDGVRSSEVLLSENEFVVQNVLSYFGVDHAMELGYTSDSDLYQAILRRKQSYNAELSDSPSLRGRHSFGVLFSPTGAVAEETALKALSECPALENLYEKTKWKLLFQSTFGSMLNFLQAHQNRIRYLELGPNKYIRLPEINQMTMGSDKEAYLCLLRSASISQSNEGSLRAFVGILIALWALKVRNSEITSAAEQAFRLLLNSESPMEVFLVATRCIELIPQELTLEIGELIVEAAMTETILRHIDQNSLANTSTTTRTVLLFIAQNISNVGLEMLLRTVPDSSSQVANLQREDENTIESSALQLSDPWSVHTVTEQVEEALNTVVDRNEELVKICEELAANRALILSPEEGKYLAKPGSEGLQAITREAVMILAQQLYTHQGRSIFELIQNADDCDYSNQTKPHLEIQLSSSNHILRLAYNEDGFEKKNILAISKINASTKVHSLSQGGKKGIGFKSVFMISEEPEVHSKGFHFKFNEHGEMGYLSPIPLQVHQISQEIDKLSRRGTVLVLPLRRTVVAVPGSIDQISEFASSSSVAVAASELQVQTKMCKQLREQLGEVDAQVILFLRRLRGITVDLGDNLENNSNFSVKFEREDRGFMRYIRATSSDGTIDINQWVVGEESSLSNPLIVPQNPVQVAIPLQTCSSCNVAALLPIRSHGLPFALNGPFQVTANREDIIKPFDSELNRQLVLRVPLAFMEAVKNVLSYAKTQVSKQHIHQCCSAIVRAVPILKSVSSEFRDVATTIIREMHYFDCLPAIIPSREERAGLYSPASLPQPVGHYYRIGDVSLVSPANAVLLSAEWREVFSLTDLAHALSAPGQVVKYLIDPDFSISSSIAKTLEIKTLDLEMLKNAIINLWNKRVVSKTGGTTINNRMVFQRLLQGFLQVVPSSKQAALMNEFQTKLQVVELSPERILVTLDKTNAWYIPQESLELMENTHHQFDRQSFIRLTKNAFNKRIIDPSISVFLEKHFFMKSSQAFYPHPNFIFDLLNQWMTGRRVDDSTKKAQIQWIALIWKWLHSFETSNELLSTLGDNDISTITTMIDEMNHKIMKNKHFIRMIKEAIEIFFPRLIGDENNRDQQGMMETTGGDVFATVRLVPMNTNEQALESAVRELYSVAVSALALILADTDEHDAEGEISTEKDTIDTDVIERLDGVAIIPIITDRIGRHGELLMFEKLKKEYPETAGYQVVWENWGTELGQPYDISIYRQEQVFARIEVKATSRDRSHPQSQLFEVSINESAIMSSERDKYWIARVYGIKNFQVHVDFDYDLIRDPFYKLNEHNWKLVCKMSGTRIDDDNTI